MKDQFFIKKCLSFSQSLRVTLKAQKNIAYPGVRQVIDVSRLIILFFFIDMWPLLYALYYLLVYSHVWSIFYE